MGSKILILLGSIRQNRQGDTVARWVHECATGRADADFELVDLKDWPLPFLETAVPPALGQYDAATRRWADKIASDDGPRVQVSGELIRAAFGIPSSPVIGAIMHTLVGGSVFVHADVFLVPARDGVAATPFSGSRSGD